MSDDAVGDEVVGVFNRNIPDPLNAAVINGNNFVPKNIAVVI